MWINVKATGLLARSLPEEGREGNTAPLEVAEGATAIDVLKKLGLSEGDNYLIVLNGQTLPKSEREVQKLNEGDSIAIMPPLKGG